MIVYVKEVDKWLLFTADKKKVLGIFDDEDAAKQRLKEIETFKKLKGELSEDHEKLIQLKELAPEVMILVPDFITIVGSEVKSPSEEGKDIDVVWRKRTIEPSDALKFIRGMPPARYHLIANPQGPHGSYYPLYDLTLSKAGRGIYNIAEGLSSEEVTEILEAMKWL